MCHPRVLACAAVAAATLSMLAPAGTATAGRAGFVTERRPFLVPVAAGVAVQPILTTGDTLGTGRRAYQMSGVPDGIGWYTSAPGVFEVYFNHELNDAFDPSGARVSHITLNASHEVTSGEYVIDGTEGYEWFCSSTLSMLGGLPWYTAGEESKHSPRKGVAFAIKATTGRVHETPWFGHFGHENIVPVKDVSKAFIGLSEDGFSEYSQYFAYIAKSFKGVLSGRQGSLRVWVPNRGVKDGDPSSNDIEKGDKVAGHFVSVRGATRITPHRLEKMVQALGAWDFDRIEDQIEDPNRPGRMYFSETGRAHAYALHGRIYQLQVNPDRPNRATLSVLLDSRDGDDIFSPDNVGISASTLMIQEDRNWKKSGSNRVVAYDLAAKTLTPVARTDPSSKIVDDRGPGAWESSGIVSAADAFGAGYWLLNVQAHYTKMKVPGRTLVPDSARGEGGQLILLFVPGT
jgi:hypothetical protein